MSLLPRRVPYNFLGKRLATASSSTLSQPTICNSSRRRCFGNGKSALPGVDPEILPYLHYKRKGEATKDAVDTAFEVWVIGSGSGMPHLDRGGPCTLFKGEGGEAIVIDAAEGSLIRILQTNIKLSNINKIFITHLHADHVAGLTTILLSLFHAHQEKGGTMHVYGPPGLYNYISANLAITFSSCRGITVVVNELVADTVSFNYLFRGWTQFFPEFRRKDIIRNFIQCGSDGVWVIKDFDKEGKTVVGRTHRDVRITAATLNHTPRVPTFGFVIEEAPPLRRLLPERAIQLGLTDGSKYEMLKKGINVLNDDETREILPDEVTVASGLKSRKFAYLADNCGVPPPMAKLCHHADVLVHESIEALESRYWVAAEKGHSTAHAAARFARKVQADLLVLNHLGNNASHQQFCSAAKEAVRGSNTRVVAAMDFVAIPIPYEGFSWSTSNLMEKALETEIGDTDKHS